MKTGKRIVTLSIIICLLLQLVSSGFTTVQAKSSNKLVVSGKIKVEVKDFTSGSTLKKRQNLKNYPVTLYYEDSNGLTKHMDIVTDELGSYKITISSQSAIKKVWLKVKAENEACVVYSKFKKWTGHTKYDFKNKTVSVDSDKQSNLTMNYTIKGKNAGAINIARVINDARTYMNKASGLVVPKVPVYWSYGKGEGSYQFDALNIEFMALSGLDQDEFDSSVICHEYGHWVFNRLRNGSFRGGNHSSKKNVDKRLAYSEGLATYFGQMALNSAIYYDGNDKNEYNSYSLENPKIFYDNLDGLKNEAYVAAALWDITDYYDQLETWDKLKEREEDVFLRNCNVIMAAELITDIKKPTEVFDAFDIDLKDFFKEYLEKHINKNSDEAYDFWRIFKENYMQIDDENPSLKLTISNNELSIKLYDNVKVSRAEIYINGKKVSTINDPSDNISYLIPTNKLSSGRNQITVKAYDYAGNDKSQFKLKQHNIYTDSPDRATVGTCYQPYAIAYCNYFFDGENIATILSKNNVEDANDDNSVIEVLADLYGLVYEENIHGSLLSEEISETRLINVSKGKDFSLLIDDTLGDYEVLLTDPNGIVYSNNVTSDEDTGEEVMDEIVDNTTADTSLQNVVNLGSRGLIAFYPTAGTWTYTIRNKGLDGDYSAGIYTKLSAPVIENEENLALIQDGTTISISGCVAIDNSSQTDSENPVITASGSAITVATGSAIIVDTEERSYTLPAKVHLELMDDSGEILVEDAIADGINESGDFTYTFNDLEDGHYYLEVYSLASDGTSSWTRTSEIVVNTKEPEIQLDDDYEYYIYSQEALLSGVINNADTIDITVNGQAVPYVGESKGDDAFAFGCNIKLNDGDNVVIISVKSETGKIVTKELVLHSIAKEEYYQEKHQPEIETVTFNGKDDTTINGNSIIEVYLTDKNISDYKVYAVCNDQTYEFNPTDDHFILDFIPTDYDNEKYEFTICVISKWQFYDEKEYEIQVVGNKEKLHIKNEPEDISLYVNETATLDLKEIFGDYSYKVETNYGTVKDKIWSFTSDEEGIFEVRLRAFNEDGEKEVVFEVMFERSKEHEIEFRTNGGELDQTEYYVIEGDEYGELPIPTKNGYDFIGWFDREVGGEQILDSTIVKEGISYILFAHWKGKSVTINFNPNGGSVEVGSKLVTYKEEYGNLPIPTKANSEFIGWYSGANGGVRISPNSIVSKTETQTLYAQWLENNYQVSFDSNGGILEEQILFVKKGEKYGTLPTPVREGYTFRGWYTAKTNGVLIQSTTIVTATSNHVLYALWNPNWYEVKFKCTGGQIEIKNKYYTETYGNYYYDNLYGTLPTPWKYGNEFTGWYTQEEGGNLITASSVVKITDKQTLYAHWKPLEFVAFFNANGGSVDIASKKVTYMSEYGELPVPVRENYIFVGWSTSTLISDLINADSQVKSAYGLTLIAIWKGKSFEVNFDANGGETIVTNKNVYFGEEYGELPIPVRKGYHFWWWCYTKTGGTNINSSTKVSIGNNHTLYAYWTGESYKTVFDPNGGKIKVGKYEYDEYANNYTYNQKYQSLYTPTRPGYEFVGWYTAKEEGELVTVDSIMTVAGEQRLYAHWREATFKVIFYPEGGVVSPANKDVTYKDKYGDLPVATREGYSFVEWRSLRAPAGEVINADSEVVATSNHYIYAQWKANTYTVSFDTEGGDLLNYSKEVEFASAYGELPIPIKTGYVFAGWVNREPGTGYAIKTTIMKTAKNHTLYAMWNPQIYTRTFDCTGGTYGNQSQYNTTYYFGREYGTLIVPTKLGHEFVGWFTQEQGGKQITKTSIVDVAEHQILYAHWKPASYTIYFHTNGGNDSVHNTTKIVTYKENYGVLPIPTRDRYEFVGWFTQTSGGTEITSMTQVEIAGAHTLYARWKGKTYNVNFYANGGYCSVSNKSVVYYEKYGDLPVPTKIGYNFSGWYTDISSGYVVTKDTIVTTSQDQTLYARWTPVYYTVTFVTYGGTVPYNSISVILGEKYGPLPTPKREGYTFLYWYRINGSTNTIEIVDEYSIVPRDNEDYRYLYARWY
ncbi:MAG: InlB B-repeat-containing protein [Clostridiales bacterium]|nr:InlB B-repeat-containing protein [Clostridiales bacterium]